MANRRTLVQAIDDVAAGKLPPGLAQAEVASHRIGPDTVDGIAPARAWQAWWQQAVEAKRAGAPWPAALTAASTDAANLHPQVSA